MRMGLAGLVLVFAGVGFWLAPRRAVIPAIVEPTVRSGGPGMNVATPATGRPDGEDPRMAQPSDPLSPDKAARVEKIKRDYDELRTKAATDYAAAGKDFPGGLNGFLKQLALLEREKRKDLAAVLTPPELEDFELRETTAGKTVQRVLGDSDATEEQRRAVFRLEREFEDRFALTFDLKPAALLEREVARQAVYEKIRAAVGDELCVTWLSGNYPDFVPLAELATRQGLPTEASLDLWRVKSEFNQRRLKLNATEGLTPAQARAAHAALAREIEVRLIGVVGAGTYQLERSGAFQWVPRP
jgi:hypothetical protein